MLRCGIAGCDQPAVWRRFYDQSRYTDLCEAHAQVCVSQRTPGLFIHTSILDAWSGPAR